ncbi:MAG: LysR family transcriptional regulator [Bacteroidota bacterium]
MELRDIEYFAVVAEHGNVRRASEALGLSPPALSKSLRRLEQSMQAKLVERTSKGVALTPVGTALLAQVGRLRLTLQDIKREAADLSQGSAGRLAIGVGATTVEDLPEAYVALLQEAPKLTGRVVVADNDVMVPALRNAELDLLFNVIPDSPYEGCVQERLFDDEFVVCAAADHPLAKRTALTLADLAHEQWALSAPTVLNVQHVFRAFEASGLPPPRVAIEARPVGLRLQICAATRLLSFNARRLLEQAAPSLGLRELPVEKLKWRRAVGVIYRKDAYLSPAARRLIGVLRAAARRRAPGD